MWPFKRKPRMTQKDIWEHERRETQSRRIKAIEKIANDHLAKARLGGPAFQVKKEVLISYEDLLKIWDLSDRIWMDL
jgi:hypothetical protein